MPEDEARAGELLNRKQVELLAEDAMVALFGFFDACQIGVEILLGEKRRAINPLELGILFVSQPVGAGDVEQLEGLIFQWQGCAGRGRNPELAGFIDGDFLSGLVNCSMKWHFMKSPSPLNFPDLLCAAEIRGRKADSAERAPASSFRSFPDHRSKRGFAVKVVEESVLGGGAVAELGLRESSSTAAASRCAEEWR